MFGRGFRILTLFGIPIKLDITFLIVLPLFTWIIGSSIRTGRDAFGLAFDVTPLREGFVPYVLGLIIVVGLFISVLIHELGHALTARIYGVRTRNITLWLLGGVAQLEQMPRQRGAEAVVAIVGPIVSFGLAVLFWLAMLLIPAQQWLIPVRYVLLYLTSMNLVLAIFNMLPALPLDGGRVLRSLLALKLDPLQATQITGGISKFFAFALGLAGVFYFSNLWLLLIAFFIYMAVNAETQQSMIEYMLRGISVRDLMNRSVVTIPPQASVGELMNMMVRERHLGFPVQEDGRLVGMIDLRHAQGVPPETPVEQIMSRDISTITENAQALDAFMKMGRMGFGRLVVIDPQGRMVGIITKTDLMRAIQIRVAATAPRDSAAAARQQFETDEDYAPSRPMP